MAANWTRFINDFSSFLQSRSSSGPEETGSKLAQFYLDAISTSQAAPMGNSFNFALTSSTLSPIFSKAFRDFFEKPGLTFEEKLKDPKYKPSEDQFPSTPSLSENSFEKEFKQYLREKKITKFTFFELDPPNSEYVLETSSDPNKLNDLFSKRGSGTRSAKEAVYKLEKEAYNSLLQKYSKTIEEESKKEDLKNQGEKDPYDDMAKAIVAFWLGSGPLVFNSLPAVLPSTEPVPGTFVIVFPGNPKTLSEGIRRAFNLGIQPEFGQDPDGSKTSKAISTALAIAFAKHLLTLKFIYNGTTLGTPTLGLVPFVF